MKNSLNKSEKEFVNPPIIHLPANGAALVKYLESVNQYESSKAGEYIKAEMAGPLKFAIYSWFKSPPLELDRAVLRKISNSVLAAGAAGLDRTVEALRLLPLEENLLVSPRTPQDAAGELRELLRHFRGAKNWLFNQSKCVNSILKTPQFPEGKTSWEQLAARDVCNKLDTKDWQSWQEDLFKLWFSTTKVTERLRGSYRNNWQWFQGSFDQSMMNGQYRHILRHFIDQIIHADDLEAYNKEFQQDQVESFLQEQRLSGKSEVEIKIEGSEVFFYLMLHERFNQAEKLNSIKSNLIYEISSQVGQESRRLAISEIASDRPTLCVRMEKPKKKEDFDSVSATIFNFCEKL
jgi:hypothetical protein